MASHGQIARKFSSLAKPRRVQNRSSQLWSQENYNASREAWERLAREDPYTFRLTGLPRNDPCAFWQSGERIVQDELLPLIVSRAIPLVLALEIGCGIGRIALPLARHFHQVVGVDIAQSMVTRAITLARDNSILNLNYFSISGPEELLRLAGSYAGKCSLIYSLLVFQHIPQFSMIAGYLHVIRFLLSEIGVAYLQFDTRPDSLFYRLESRLPDRLLPKSWRRGIRRIRRPAKDIETCLLQAGLEIVAEFTPQSAYHRFILRTAPRRVGSR